MSNKLSQMQKWVATWHCEDCGKTVDMSYNDIVDVGTPICPNCDQDMAIDIEDDLTPKWSNDNDDDDNGEPRDNATPKMQGHDDDCCCSLCE